MPDLETTDPLPWVTGLNASEQRFAQRCSCGCTRYAPRPENAKDAKPKFEWIGGQPGENAPCYIGEHQLCEGCVCHCHAAIPDVPEQVELPSDRALAIEAAYEVVTDHRSDFGQNLNALGALWDAAAGSEREAALREAIDWIESADQTRYWDDARAHFGLLALVPEAEGEKA